MSEETSLDHMDYPKIEEAQPELKEMKLVRWRQIHQANGPSPKPRHGHRAMTIKDLIVILGGGNEGMIDELHVYNTQKSEWVAPQTRGELPGPCAAFGAVVLGTKIYIFGGMIEYGRYTNNLSELQATRWEWKRLHPSCNDDYPVPRLGHSFVASQKTQKAYVFGGLANELNDNKRNVPRYLNDLYMIDLSKPYSALHWEKPIVYGQPPSPRESHTAVIYETENVRRMIVYGGMNGCRLGDLWYLDLDTMHWTEVKARSGIPPMPRSLHTSVMIGDKMYIYGGWIPVSDQLTESNLEKEWKCTSTLGCWDISEERWVPLHLYSNEEESIPRGRSGHCAAVVGSRMYVWSGRDGYRKAWSNQVCCRDMWLLDTIKAEQPGRVHLSRAGFQSLEVSWPPVQGAESYFLQIGFGDPKDSLSPTKDANRRGVSTTPRKQALDIQKESELATKPSSLISTQGTTYTAPVTSKPAVDESGLPQDLFEDSSEKNDSNVNENLVEPAAEMAAPKEEEPLNLEPKKEEITKPSEEPKIEGKDEEADDLPWFDVGIVADTAITVSHYFNERHQRLENQLADLVDQCATKCINDSVYTNEDKVPLITGQTYRFRVSAINGLGRGPWSESTTYKTCLPGYPSAPSSIRITKSIDGAQLTWEPPGNSNVSGKIVEYSVYLAVKNQSANSADSQLAFMRVYCGPQAECQVPQANLGTAYVDQTNKPAIIFRIAARNEKGYGPATQVRWLQDQQKVPMRNTHPALNTGGFHYQSAQPTLKRARFEPQQ